MKMGIINPSDECYITSDDKEAACASILLLSEGKYALEDENGNTVMPILMFGGHDEFWLSEFGHKFEDYLATKPFLQMAEALESFEYPRERTSMNNIGEAAANFAKLLRNKK